jgi:hypothetical protein
MKPKVKEMDEKQQPSQEPGSTLSHLAMWLFLGAIVVACLALAYSAFSGK